ncbi:unnamed protein product [Acanthosepion pharaonis]|uniref:Uncharacterized protein n=1 Tax=Acanthosepion pharaonis TaxID=158019 RepID=A0A812DWJ4_ACAPH|nr:unnamed protein product [Sepia pharaonis]
MLVEIQATAEITRYEELSSSSSSSHFQSAFHILPSISVSLSLEQFISSPAISYFFSHPLRLSSLFLLYTTVFLSFLNFFTSPLPSFLSIFLFPLNSMIPVFFPFSLFRAFLVFLARSYNPNNLLSQQLNCYCCIKRSLSSFASTRLLSRYFLARSRQWLPSKTRTQNKGFLFLSLLSLFLCLSISLLSSFTFELFFFSSFLFKLFSSFTFKLFFAFSFFFNHFFFFFFCKFILSFFFTLKKCSSLLHFVLNRYVLFFPFYPLSLSFFFLFKTSFFSFLIFFSLFFYIFNHFFFSSFFLFNFVLLICFPFLSFSFYLCFYSLLFFYHNFWTPTSTQSKV